MTPQRRNRVLLIAASGAWLLMLCVGWMVLTEYENRPGAVGNVPATWPAPSTAAPSPDTPTLALFAHPRCPCTRATIGELARLMTRLQGQLHTHVFFYTPNDAPTAWAQTDLWRRAARIPGVSVHVDEGGAEAEHFGALTSGQTVLYDRNRRLAFVGGITGARGHEGDNAGRQAITEFVTTGHTTLSRTFVFGCFIQQQTSLPSS